MKKKIKEEDKILDRRSNMSNDEYNSFFGGVINPKVIKTNNSCPVNQRCNVDEDGHTTKSITDSNEERSYRAVGLDHKKQVDFTARQLRDYRKERENNAN